MTDRPTDVELIAFAVEEEFLLFCDQEDFVEIARSVLAKWGAQSAPAASPEPHYLPPLITAQINHLRNTAYRDGEEGEPSGLLGRVHERLGAIILAELKKARQPHGITKGE
jgi:hypothetical protein